MAAKATASAAGPDLAVGSRVLTGRGFTSKGEVRFIGTTSFAAGEWIGIKLDLPEGKNDGSVGDARYFDAEPNHGLFVRRIQVKLDQEATLASAAQRQKLSILKDKRSSMLRDAANATSSIPSLKSSASMSSTASLGSEGSSAAPSRMVRPTAAEPATPAPPVASARATTPPPTEAATPARRTALPMTKSQMALLTPAPPKKPAAPPAAASKAYSTPAPASATPAVQPTQASAAADEPDVASAAPDEQQDDVEAAPAEPAEEPVEREVAAVESAEAPEISAATEPDSAADSAAVDDAVMDVEKTEPAMVAEDPGDVAVEHTFAKSETESAPTVTVQAAARTEATAASIPTPAPTIPAAPALASAVTPAPAPVAAPAPPPATAPASAAVPATAPAAGPFSTPQRDNSLRRFPSSRTNTAGTSGTPSGEGGAAGPTPSKDAALIQFMQTSIYKLNQEKDELFDKVTTLNAEIERLNQHLLQSQDLTTSMQEEVDREAAQRMALQAELRAAQEAQEQARLQADREAAALRERIKKLENTPPPKDPRVAELEAEVDKLTRTVETLTLDKEALAVEQELLDEKYLQAQIELEEALAEVQTLTSLNEARTAAAVTHTAASGSSSGDGADVLALRAENDKLREALRRLNTSAAQDKATVTTQTAKLAALEAEVADLRSYKAQAEGDLQALRGSVDSMASFEAMIEKLSEENLELTEKLQEAQQAVRDLEDSAELNEEIDQQQRKQIDADRSVIDMLNVTVANIEQQVAERDKALLERDAALNRVKLANKTLKAEIARLDALLSTGSEESKQLEHKLRELAYLRANQDLLTGELHSVQQALLTSTAQKHKYQALYTRMDAIFGGTAVFIEESKQINTEIAFVSTAAAGLEACRSVVAVVDGALQADAGGADESAGVVWEALIPAGEQDVPVVPLVPLAGKLHLLLLQAEAYVVQCCLDLFRPASGGGKSTTSTPSPGTIQRILDLKGRFEVAAQLSSRMKTTTSAIWQEWRTHSTATNNSRAVLDAGAEGDLDGSFQRDRQGASRSEPSPFAPSEGNLRLYQDLLQEYASLVSDLTQQMSPSLDSPDALNLLQNCALLTSCPTVDPTLQLELLCLSMNTLCDIGLQDLQDASGGVQYSSLRSLKSDLKAAVLNFKANTAHYVDHLSEVVGNYQLLVSCFFEASPGGVLALNFEAETTEGVVKMVQSFVRKLNAAPGLQSTVSSTAQLMLGVTGVMRYFPFSVVTNAAAGADAALSARLREQFEQHVGKYWMLTTQTNSDLLLPVHSAGVAPAAAAGASGASTYTEVSWRQRVADARNLIAEKFGAIVLPSRETEGAAEVSAAVTETPSKSATAAQQGAKMQALLAELEVKRDELRAAMDRCDDLQAQLDSALAASATAAGSGSNAGTGKRAGAAKKGTKGPREVPELLEEIATLEEALFATEQRVEALEQESKALKAQAAAAAASAPATGAAAKESGDAGAMAGWDFKPTGKKRVTPAVAMVSAAQYQAVLDQCSHWRALVLKRLTASLAPLPALPTLTPAATHAAEDAAQPKAPLVAEAHKLTFKHIEVVAERGLTGQSAAEDYAAIYHKLRMARASGARIKLIHTGGEGGAGAAERGATDKRARSRLRNSLLYRVNF